MSAIKRFFEKRKLDVKFKQAGGGHRLTDETKAGRSSAGPSHSHHHQRAAPSSEAQAAAQAALTRINPTTSRPVPKPAGPAIKTQASQELKREQTQMEQAMTVARIYQGPEEVELEAAPVLAVTGVYFHCPMVGPEVLPKQDMDNYIGDFLVSQLGEEPEMSSALMIHTLNKDPEGVKAGIGVLCKYIDNLISNPGQEKYSKIRINNKAFQERVLPLKGTQEFLQAAGFDSKMLPGPNGAYEEFYVMEQERGADVECLANLKEVLLAAEPIKAQLDRNAKVLHPSSKSLRMEVPAEFYNITKEELKREQDIRQEATERLGMLRTKEMRERDRIKELRRYRYCLVRVRFPDGILLQGTFRAQEKASSVFDFVRQNIEHDWIPFLLSSQAGQTLCDESLSLAELDLAPAALVSFSYDPTVLAEVTAQRGSFTLEHYLKTQVMANVQAM